MDLEYINSYALGKQLGKGAFATVREAQRGEGPSAKKFAMKVFNKSALRKMKQWERDGRRMKVTTGLDKMKVEIAIMKKVKHDHLVQCFEVIDDEDNDKLFMALELCDRGQVMDFDAATRKYRRTGSDTPVFSEDEARTIIKQVAEALLYLHKNNIAHRDVKPENILLQSTPDGSRGRQFSRVLSPQRSMWATRVNAFTPPTSADLFRNYQVKLTDLGVSLMGPESSISTSGASAQPATMNGTAQQPWHFTKKTEGTVHFFAPECCTGEPFSVLPVDVWSVGVTLFCLLSGQLPFDGNTPAEVMDVIQNQEPDWKAVPVGADSQALDLLKRLLNKLPSERITLSELLRHPWVKNAVPNGGTLEIEEEEKLEGSPVSVSLEEIENAVTPKIAVSTLTKLKFQLHKRRVAAAKRLLRQAWA